VIELAKLLVVISVLGTAVGFGTDTFCALVLRPALAVVDDRAWWWWVMCTATATGACRYPVFSAA
jgi:hypothetical protein